MHQEGISRSHVGCSRFECLTWALATAYSIGFRSERANHDINGHKNTTEILTSRALANCLYCIGVQSHLVNSTASCAGWSYMIKWPASWMMDTSFAPKAVPSLHAVSSGSQSSCAPQITFTGIALPTSPYRGSTASVLRWAAWQSCLRNPAFPPCLNQGAFSISIVSLGSSKCAALRM